MIRRVESAGIAGVIVLCAGSCSHFAAVPVSCTLKHT
jgi:hypothetical protein